MPQQQTAIRPEESDSPSAEPNGKSRPPNLPLIAISGAAGKTTTGWLLVNILEQAGMEVGAWLSNGVYVDRTLRHDELHAWELATYAARAREIDVLIQEVPSVLASRLPARSIGAGIFTSICGSDGHCQRGPDARRDQAAAQSVANSIVSGGKIAANADDLMIVDAISGATADVTYYALNGANPILREHVELGGNACWVDDGWVKVHINGSTRQIVRVADLPDSLDGHLIFQVQDALAALAAALPILGDELDADHAFANIAALDPDRKGGVHVITSDHRTIVADFPRSLLSIKHLARGIRSYSPRRVIVCIRDMSLIANDEDLEAARILGLLAGIAVVVEDNFDADQLTRLKHAMMDAAEPPVIVVRRDDEVSVKHIFSLLEEGDIALILTDNPKAVTALATGSRP